MFSCLNSKYRSIFESILNATWRQEIVLGPLLFVTVGRVECMSSESLHMFTEAVLLFAARLTVDHQVRHLHSNLGLFLNFLLLPDLKLGRKKNATSCLHTLGKKQQPKKQRALRL